MSIKQFQLFHGAVLTKLTRSDQPGVTLRMIKTEPTENWSIYTINEEVDIFIKHRAKGNPTRWRGGGISWHFVFTQKQVKKIAEQRLNNDVYIALVCGNKTIEDAMYIAFLKPDEIDQILNFSINKSQSFTVTKYNKKGELQILKGKRPLFKVPQNRLKTWSVPGS